MHIGLIMKYYAIMTSNFMHISFHVIYRSQMKYERELLGNM